MQAKNRPQDAQALLALLSQCKQALRRGLRATGAALALVGAAAGGMSATSAAAAECPPQALQPPPSRAAMHRMSTQARDHGLLWRVDYQGRTAWIYGTLHVGRLPWIFPGPTVKAALSASDSLALELNLFDPALLQAVLAGFRADPQAPTLPTALADRLAAQEQAACLPAEAMKALRPDARVVTLLTQAGRSQGLDPAYGIDTSLAAAAQAMGKPIWSLETPEGQLKVLLSNDPAEVQDSVRAGLVQLESGEATQSLLQLTQAWADGRENLLESYPLWCHCMDSAKERADYQRQVLDRNPAMAAQVAAQLRAGHAPFVAVGSLHVVGPQGLPALLAAQGFAVQRVGMHSTAPARAAPADHPQPQPEPPPVAAPQ